LFRASNFNLFEFCLRIVFVHRNFLRWSFAVFGKNIIIIEMKKIVGAFLLFVFIFSFCFLGIVLAKDEKDESGFLKKTALGVNPAIIEAISGDQPVSKKITLYNLTNFPLPIKTLRESFSPKEKLEIPKEKLTLFDASSWIKLDEKDVDFILQPKEAREIKMTILSPLGASPGGHYASLVFQPMIPQESVSKDSVFVFARVAALLFIQKKGEIVENLSVRKFDVNYYNQKLPIEITLQLKNSGNTHLRPVGKVMIQDNSGKKIIMNLPIPESIILPGTSKNYNVTIEESLAKKIGSGRYSIKAQVMYGTNNQIIQTKFKFFILFPWTGTIVVLILGLLLMIFIFKMKKRIVKASTLIFYGEKHFKKKYAKEIREMKIKKIPLDKK
jgi:hypothetical protein